MTQLDRVLVARGGKRPETDAEWAQYAADKAARRIKNVVSAQDCLDRNGVPYVQLAATPEVLLRIALESGGCIHYYPERGLWFCDDERAQHFGVRNLVKHIKGEVK